MRHAVAVIIVSATLACTSGRMPSTPPSAAPPTPATLAASVAADSTAAIRAANELTVAEILRTIPGQESRPAGEVFAQVRRLKDVPTRTFLTIMSIGYANALGVRCAHCHDVSDFSSDAKRPKRAAREMQVMHRSVNTQLIAMENLATQPPDKRTINCNTCHQGRINPNAR